MIEPDFSEHRADSSITFGAFPSPSIKENQIFEHQANRALKPELIYILKANFECNLANPKEQKSDNFWISWICQVTL